MASTAGVTVPSTRQVYITKVQISSKDKTKPKSKPSKSLRTKSGKSKGKDGEELHKSWGRSKDYAYVFTGTGEEKPWTKNEPRPPNKPKTYKSKTKPVGSVEEDHHIYKIKEDGKRKVKKGTLVVSDKYFEAVKEERSRLLDLLNSLQKRNDVLERENADMVKNFDILLRENQQLRKKLETGEGEPVVESYKRVYDDRKLLREAENSYKKRLHKLEEDQRILQRNYDRVVDELNLVKAKNTKSSEETSYKGKYNRYYWDCYHLKAENEFLKNSVKSLKGTVAELSANVQKSPKTAPPVPPARTKEPFVPPPKEAYKQPKAPDIPQLEEVYGQRIKYVTLPEIDERLQNERLSGKNERLYGIHV